MTQLVVLNNDVMQVTIRSLLNDPEAAMAEAEAMIEAGRFNDLDIVDVKPLINGMTDLEVAGSMPDTLKNTAADASAAPRGAQPGSAQQPRTRKGKLLEIGRRLGGVLQAVSAAVVTTAAAVTAANAAYGAFHETRYHVARVAARKPINNSHY